MIICNGRPTFFVQDSVSKNEPRNLVNYFLAQYRGSRQASSVLSISRFKPTPNVNRLVSYFTCAINTDISNYALDNSYCGIKTSTIKQPPTGKHHFTQNVIILGIITRDLNQIFNLTLGSIRRQFSYWLYNPDSLQTLFRSAN